MPTLRALVTCVLVLACAAPRPPAEPAPHRAPVADETSLAIVDVTVIDPRDGAARPHQTVVVRDSAIVAVGPRAEVAVPQGARRVSGASRFLVPGLSDMHVHLPETEVGIRRTLALSLAHGVTRLRSMQGHPAHLEARARLRASGDPAPEMILGSPPLSESMTAEEAAAWTRAQHEAGYDFIKFFGGFDLDAYRAIHRTARALDMPVCGHLPDDIGIDAALEERQASIEHLMGYREAAESEDEEALRALAARTRDAGVHHCPTLGWFALFTEDGQRAALESPSAAFAGAETVAAWRAELGARTPSEDPARRLERLGRILRALEAEGAPLLVGSDSPDAGILPGFGMVDEMALWVRMGVSPASVLRAATANAARYFDPGDPGALVAGARADAVLLDGDPRASIAPWRRPRAVLVRGQWLDRAALDDLLAQVAR